MAKYGVRAGEGRLKEETFSGLRWKGFRVKEKCLSGERPKGGSHVRAKMLKVEEMSGQKQLKRNTCRG